LARAAAGSLAVDDAMGVGLEGLGEGSGVAPEIPMAPTTIEAMAAAATSPTGHGLTRRASAVIRSLAASTTVGVGEVGKPA